MRDPWGGGRKRPRQSPAGAVRRCSGGHWCHSKANDCDNDGEGVVLGKDGKSDFARLHSRSHDDAVQLLGFDLLELDGADLRREPLERRKAALAKLLRRSHDGMQLVEHIEAVDGATVFAHACKLGLEGIVSKRRDARYQHGRSRAWLKVKNPASPAMTRVWEERF
jgi:bifunctional non-homologous end joining protein LigD